MGAGLVIDSFAFAALYEVSDVPTRLLVYMAVRAIDPGSERDGQTARLSFMKRQQLAQGLGRFMPDREPGPDGSDEERKKWARDNKAVARALRALHQAGAIEPVGGGYNGRTMEFEICLDPAHSSAIKRPPSETLSVPDGRRSVSEKGDAHRTPNKESEVREELREEHHVERTTYVQPVQKSSRANDEAA